MSRRSDEEGMECLIIICFLIIIGIPIAGICMMVYGCNEYLCPRYTYEKRYVTSVSEIRTGQGSAPLIQFDTTCSVTMMDVVGKFRSTESLINYGLDKYPIGSEVGIVRGVEPDQTICYFSKGKYNSLMISGTVFVTVTLVALGICGCIALLTCISDCERAYRLRYPPPSQSQTSQTSVTSQQPSVQTVTVSVQPEPNKFDTYKSSALSQSTTAWNH